MCHLPKSPLNTFIHICYPNNYIFCSDLYTYSDLLQSAQVALHTWCSAITFKFPFAITISGILFAPDLYWIPCSCFKIVLCSVITLSVLRMIFLIVFVFLIVFFLNNLCFLHVAFLCLFSQNIEQFWMSAHIQEQGN